MPRKSASGARPRLRVVFITQDDPLYVARFFETFFAEYPKQEFEILGITVDRTFDEPLVQSVRRMLRLYGPLDFARLGWRYARARLRGAGISGMAARAGVEEVPATGSVNDSGYVARMDALAPDVIVSVAAPQIFRRELLAAARLGCVNVHSGRLPDYRGMMPNFWQLLAGERQAEITVHEMVPKLDAGDVIATDAVEIRPRDSLDRLMRETKRTGARLLIRVLRSLADGSATSRPLDMDRARYFSFPTPDDVSRLEASGHRML